MVVLGKVAAAAVDAQVPADLRVLRTVAVRLNPVVLALLAQEAVAGTPEAAAAVAAGMAAAVVEQTTTLAVPMPVAVVADLPMLIPLWSQVSVTKQVFRMEPGV
jgi:hypothetical protein